MVDGVPRDGAGRRGALTLTLTLTLALALTCATARAAAVRGKPECDE